MSKKNSFKSRLIHKINSLRVVRKVKYWAKTRSIWGFFNIPVYTVLSFIIQEVKNDSLITRANSIAFSFFLSLFPGLLATVTLIPLILPIFEEYLLPYISQDLIVMDGKKVDIKSTLLNQLNDVLIQLEVIPHNVIETFNSFAAELLLEPRIGLFSFGYILAIFFASNGMMRLMKGFEKSSNEAFLNRNPLHARLISLKLLFTLIGTALLSIISIIIGNYIFPYIFAKLNISGITVYFLNVLRWMLTLALFYIGIAMIYRNGIATKEKVGFFSAGATLATFLSITSSFIFAFWVDSFNRYNELYGSIGTIIVLMLWIQINALILLIGFELNASIQVNKSLIQKEET